MQLFWSRPRTRALYIPELTFVCSLVRGSPEASVYYRAQGKQVASGHKLRRSVHVPYMGYTSARDVYACYTGGTYVHAQCTLMYQIRGIRPVRVKFYTGNDDDLGDYYTEDKHNVYVCRHS